MIPDIVISDDDESDFQSDWESLDGDDDEPQEIPDPGLRTRKDPAVDVNARPRDRSNGVLLRIPLGPGKHAVFVGERKDSRKVNAVFAVLNDKNAMRFQVSARNRFDEPIGFSQGQGLRCSFDDIDLQSMLSTLSRAQIKEFVLRWQG